MLQELTIRNFAIIEDLTIGFESGLTILSGETGAGKSIIINAVNLLLGSRVSATLIRTGADHAELEAFFSILPESGVAKVMTEHGYDPQEGLMVRRIISRKDRHRIYINGRMATMQILTAITANLASISGQHAHQGLLKEEEHLLILDQYGGLMDLREKYHESYRQVLPLIAKEQQLIRRQADQSEQMELLQFQVQEIEAANVQANEDKDLEAERLRLKNGQMLFETVQQCVDGLYRIDGAVFERLGHMSKALAKCEALDPELREPAGEMESLAYGAEDLAANLRDYLARIDLDPLQLERVEERLDILNRLKRKYGGSIEAVLEFAADANRQLDEIGNVEGALVELRDQLHAAHSRLCTIAQTLSKKREQAAQSLAKAVEAELTSLRMANTRFSAAIEPLKTSSETSSYLQNRDCLLAESGMDRAAFMIAPNVGEDIKPLTAIASGGELSRIVLALKAILAHNDSLETVVFDEVDAGIGGGVAEMVGKKLAALARYHQILCITHLPQIAKYGRHHFRIEKRVSKGRTHTTIARLSAEARVEEVARMLGGERITPATMDHAKEMLADKRTCNSK
ncbi:MAG: DNA repair protein RecN [Desulfobacteraceae bacterium]|jgi:DNA repair protein RecN (Recombination protein N)